MRKCLKCKICFKFAVRAGNNKIIGNSYRSLLRNVESAVLLERLLLCRLVVLPTQSVIILHSVSAVNNRGEILNFAIEINLFKSVIILYSASE